MTRSVTCPTCGKPWRTWTLNASPEVLTSPECGCQNLTPIIEGGDNTPEAA